MRERAELDHEHEEDERDGQAEGDEELAERRLLLLIKTAMFDRCAGGEVNLTGDPRLDLGDRRAEVAAFEASRDRDGLPQAFAVDLRLAGIVVDRGNLIDAHVAVR